eukprot:CAMPEP_0174878532 /NCGR_PEP_ID=MMETSP1114-20130205/82803_1 /TAXON_ID=312471 /ORGANISM="Neobodo designis, Strain CCAP 1951/1" /LENGTH=414 /DNA_ID=CAMNT_0016113921 /DNA_START=43 /DNA_END=1287 /DNA_ORIENTATION=+
MRRTVAAPLSAFCAKRGPSATLMRARSHMRWACPFSGDAAASTASTATAAAAGSAGAQQASASPSGSCPMMGNVPAETCPVEGVDTPAPAPPTAKQIVNTLGKQRLSAFVTSTASAGYVLCGGTSLPMLTAVTLGTYLQSLSANTSNQCIEIENDRMMKRTHKRPLVTGAITRPAAIALAAAELAAGTGLLAATGGTTVAALGVANWVMYVCVYTPLKRVSTTNTWWGAIVGAVPPVMGGVAAAGSLSAAAMPPAYLLGGVLFVWQIPHFMSLAYHCRRDYEHAGFKMLPYSNPRRASIYAVSLSVIMAGLTLPGLPMAGMVVEPWFYAASAACNAGMVYKSVLFHVHPEKYCRSCFVFSYMYLAVMLALLVANHFQPMTAAQHLYQRATSGHVVLAVNAQQAEEAAKAEEGSA